VKLATDQQLEIKASIVRIRGLVSTGPDTQHSLRLWLRVVLGYTLTVLIRGLDCDFSQLLFYGQHWQFNHS
jgi:hypothetical protein